MSDNPLGMGSRLYAAVATGLAARSTYSRGGYAMLPVAERAALDLTRDRATRANEMLDTGLPRDAADALRMTDHDLGLNLDPTDVLTMRVAGARRGWDEMVRTLRDTTNWTDGSGRHRAERPTVGVLRRSLEDAAALFHRVADTAPSGGVQGSMRQAGSAASQAVEALRALDPNAPLVQVPADAHMAMWGVPHALNEAANDLGRERVLGTSRHIPRAAG